MKWMKLTRYTGEEVFGNVQQVVYVEAYDIHWSASAFAFVV